jgi:hypothetical protein
MSTTRKANGTRIRLGLTEMRGASETVPVPPREARVGGRGLHADLELWLLLGAEFADKMGVTDLAEGPLAKW